MSIYDTLYSRKDGGDPTMMQVNPDLHDTTISNPGFREGSRTGSYFFKLLLTLLWDMFVCSLFR